MMHNSKRAFRKRSPLRLARAQCGSSDSGPSAGNEITDLNYASSITSRFGIRTRVIEIVGAFFPKIGSCEVVFARAEPACVAPITKTVSFGASSEEMIDRRFRPILTTEAASWSPTDASEWRF